MSFTCVQSVQYTVTQVSLHLQVDCRHNVKLALTTGQWLLNNKILSTANIATAKPSAISKSGYLRKERQIWCLAGAHSNIQMLGLRCTKQRQSCPSHWSKWPNSTSTRAFICTTIICADPTDFADITERWSCWSLAQRRASTIHFNEKCSDLLSVKLKDGAVHLFKICWVRELKSSV